MRRTELADAAESYVRDVTEAYGNGIAGVDAVIAEAKGRFLGVGAAQYQISETEQSFERSTVGTMLVGMSEELVDQVNYAVMIDILIGRRLERIVPNGNLSGSYDIACALLDLQRDLGEMAYAAVCASALMRRHLERLVELGEYTPRSESDYVSQLAAECREAGSPMRGSASGRGSREIDAYYASRATPDTPEGLDEIVAACRMDDDGAGD